MPKEKQPPPIKSGWRGHLNGVVEGTESTRVKVQSVTIEVDYKTLWALCNHLYDASLGESKHLEEDQVRALSNLGAAVGRLIDHPSANNGGREIVKP